MSWYAFLSSHLIPKIVKIAVDNDESVLKFYMGVR